jgi:hypothetical protein
MADASETPAQTPGSGRFIPAETLIYRWSPLGMWGTTLAILVISLGSFALIAETTGQPHLGYVDAAGQWRFNTVSWIGFVLSMILTAALGLTELGRRRELAERANLLAALDPAGHAAASALSDGEVRIAWRRRYWLLTALGFAGGLVFNIYMAMSESVSLTDYLQSIGLWFLLFSPPLYAVGLRAGLGLARDGRELRQLVDAHVEIDLYHLERLHVFGRLGLGGAGSWLVMAGVLLLFVADPRQVWFAVPGIGIAALSGILAFAGAVRPIQRKIQQAKARELVQVHDRMAEARDRAFNGDDSAATALAGLTDYEVWVERRPEWPVSTSIGLRFSLYILIPVLPILGSYLFEKMADGLIYGGVF